MCMIDAVASVDNLLALAGMTPADYARAKGLPVGGVGQRLLSPEQAMDYLGMKRNRLYQLVAAGELKPIPVGDAAKGRATAFDLRDLDAWITKRKRQPRRAGA